MSHVLTIVPVLIHAVRIGRILQQDAEDGGEIPLHSHVEHGALVVVNIHHSGTCQQLAQCVCVCVCVVRGGSGGGEGTRYYMHIEWVTLFIVFIHFQ